MSDIDLNTKDGEEFVSDHDFMNDAEWLPQKKRDTCSRCGQKGVKWKCIDDKWKLVDRSGLLHICGGFKAIRGGTKVIK